MVTVKRASPGSTKLRVSSRFVLRGVWVVPDALGRSFTWDWNGSRVTLKLPRGQRDYAEDEPEVPKVPAWLPTARMEGSGDAVAIQLILVDADFFGPVSAADKARATNVEAGEGDNDSNYFRSTVEQQWQMGHSLAEQAAYAWLAHIRVVSGQPWLGIAVEPPRQYGRSHIFDIESDVRLMSFAPVQSATIRSGQLALTIGQLDDIESKVASRTDVSPAEALLADSRFLAQEAHVVDAQRAVLVAAVACEIKTKDTIKARTDASRIELLSLVLGRVSNVPELLDRVLSAAIGTSLRTSEPVLFSRIKRLSELRNQIVHQGKRVDQNEGRNLVVVANQLFEWLDRL